MDLYRLLVDFAVFYLDADLFRLVTRSVLKGLITGKVSFSWWELSRNLPIFLNLDPIQVLRRCLWVAFAAALSLALHGIGWRFWSILYGSVSMEPVSPRSRLVGGQSLWTVDRTHQNDLAALPLIKLFPAWGCPKIFWMVHLPCMLQSFWWVRLDGSRLFVLWKRCIEARLMQK